MRHSKQLLYGVLLVIVSSCTNDVDKVDDINRVNNENVELAKDVEILYSDSAQLKVKIKANKMIRHHERGKIYDVFDEGIHVEFLNPSGRAGSWLDADKAIRKEREDLVLASGDVKFYNKKNETLTTTELIWDGKNHKLYTNKFVRITRPMKGDTSYGFGFEANEEFTRFEIKRKTSARFNIEKYISGLEK